LAAAIFGAAGLGFVASRRWIVEQFTDAEEVVLAANGYFNVTGFVSVVLFSAYQGWGGQRFCCWEAGSYCNGPMRNSLGYIIW
jgi:hypothetical protein